MLEKVATEKAQGIVEQRLSEESDQNYVNTLEAENKDWLYDEQGNVSAEGLAVQKIYRTQKQWVLLVKPRWEYATRMVERDLLLAKMNREQQQPAVQNNRHNLSPSNLLLNNLRRLNKTWSICEQALRSSSQRGASQQTNARAPEAQMTFQERLLAQAQEQGL